MICHKWETLWIETCWNPLHFEIWMFYYSTNKLRVKVLHSLMVPCPVLCPAGLVHFCCLLLSKPSSGALWQQSDGCRGWRVCGLAYRLHDQSLMAYLSVYLFLPSFVHSFTRSMVYHSILMADRSSCRCRLLLKQSGQGILPGVLCCWSSHSDIVRRSYPTTPPDRHTRTATRQLPGGFKRPPVALYELDLGSA